MTKPEPLLRRGAPGSSRAGSSLGGVPRWTRMYTSPGFRRSERSARRSLIRTISGATAVSELSRQGLGPAAVDGPEHALANETRNTRTNTARRGDADIEILLAAVNAAERSADRAGPDRKSTRLNSSHRTISYAV